MQILLRERASSGRASMRPDTIFWAALSVAFLAGVGITAYFCASMSRGMRMPGGWTMSMMWMRMPGQSWGASAAIFLATWVGMMVAMMVPCLALMLLSYRRSLRRAGIERIGWPTMLAALGYFFTWGLAGAVVYPFGVGLSAAEMRWSVVSRSVPIAVGVVVALVGAVQLTRWKARQLSRCQVEPGCGSAHGAAGAAAWRHGIRLGVRCATCCLGLMVLLLVVGVMNPWVMLAVTIAITAERVAWKPRQVARTTGIVLLLIGAGLVVWATRMP